jgi:hypothetical protein
MMNMFTNAAIGASLALSLVMAEPAPAQTPRTALSPSGTLRSPLPWTSPGSA